MGFWKYCFAPTSADSNIAIRCIFGIEVVLDDLHPPLVVGVAGGADMQCLHSLGKRNLQDIGIDIDGLFDQLAGGVSPKEPDLAFKVDNDEIDDALSHMIDDALKAGFDSSKAKGITRASC
ncbi:hypothetical protein CCR75_001463 [Bremia lactucae]|uniref:Uncharacterized protein n=1 Tax=Bremia lactucae TaxID=4779 RepID=A0A976IMB7_BRELC|nr:hypothetical protein CCR75_001463 [Bremia lactucae]